jgi:CTP synthase (UTP-ammonia lyase)
MRICLVGDFNPEVLAHQAIPKALALAADGRAVEPVWLSTESSLEADLEQYDGFWCVPASPYRSMEGALRVIRFARENRRPFLGTCGGCQHAVLEFARNVLGVAGAGHKEIEPATPEPVITNLACALIESSEKLQTMAGSRFREIYGSAQICEQYHCSYGVNEGYVPRLERAGLRVGITGPDGETRAVELDGHPCFFGTLFQPERSAFRGRRHPLIGAFVNACQRPR